MCIRDRGGAVDGLDWNIEMMNGTVLDDGEDPYSTRAKEAVGPWQVLSHHGAHQLAPDYVAHMPGGAEWKAAIDAERPEGQRHLAVHLGHVTNLVDRDRPLLDVDDFAYGAMTWVGNAEEIAARAAASDDAGASELMYTPAGPDIAREMRTFAEAVIR